MSIMLSVALLLLSVPLFFSARTVPVAVTVLARGRRRRLKRRARQWYGD